MKKTKVIIPAMGLLVLSTAASITGTVAWFSVNNKVTVSGMTARTSVSSNLLISEDNVEANYATSMANQSIAGVLQPVSTIDGFNFFYSLSSNVAGDGTAKEDHFNAYSEATALENTGANKDSYDLTFNNNYGFTAPITTSNVCYGYFEYSFHLKATTTSANQKVSLKECNLLYNQGNLTANDMSWRVAVFAQEVAASTPAAALADTDLVSILRLSGAAYNNSGKAVAAADRSSVAWDNLAAPTNLDAAATIGTIATAGNTQRYKVTVRLYLEGNDSKCTNETYALLTQSYSLDLAFELGTTAGLTNLESSAIDAILSADNTASLNIRNGATTSGYQWQKYENSAWSDIQGATSATYEGDAGTVVRCVVATSNPADGSFASSQVTLAALA